MKNELADILNISPSSKQFIAHYSDGGLMLAMPASSSFIVFNIPTSTFSTVDIILLKNMASIKLNHFIFQDRTGRL